MLARCARDAYSACGLVMLYSGPVGLRDAGGMDVGKERWDTLGHFGTLWDIDLTFKSYSCFFEKKKKVMSYKKLEVWKLAREVVVDIHKMTLLLPSFEQYEEGRQIRKSSKSTKSTIVEGYGRRRYKQDYIRFIVYALSSNDESIDHLETLYETGSLADEALYNDLHERLNTLGKKLNSFLAAIERNHRSDR